MVSAARTEPSAHTVDLIVQADLLWPYAVRVAATLHLADLVQAGTNRLDELAQAAGADPDALGRLLRFLASRGLLAEPQPNVFSMTPAAEPLLSTHPARLREWLDLTGVNARMERAFGQLLDVVRTGEPAYPKMFGRSFWADVVDDPTIAASFDTTMAAQSSWSADAVAAAFDWTAAQRVTDVGGGNGTLLAAILNRHPQLQGTLVDLPGAIAAARGHLAESGVAERCALVEGDFFTPLPPGADVYVLANVLHDWNDAEAERILSGCALAAAATPGGRVLIVERITDALDSASIAGYDLRMLVVYGGRERTLAQFAALARRAGLVVAGVQRLPTGLGMMECRANGPA